MGQVQSEKKTTHLCVYWTASPLAPIARDSYVAHSQPGPAPHTKEAEESPHAKIKRGLEIVAWAKDKGPPKRQHHPKAS